MANTKKLLAGFGRFKDRYFGNDKTLYASMQEGQPAKTLMIACSDSRVDPAILTDCDPGDIFTIRNVANLVPPCEAIPRHHGTSSAIEFAVNALNVQNIIVMGHANCGGIHALWSNDNGQGDSQFIHHWVAIAQNAKQWVLVNAKNKTDEEQLKLCEQRSVVVSLENLMTFPFVKERVEQGKLAIYGWYFDLRAGEIMCYSPESDQFECPSHYN